MADSPVVLVTLFIVGESRSQMCSDQADGRVGILHANSHSALVACHTRHAGLFQSTFNILDKWQNARFDKDRQRATDQLATSQHDIFFRS